MVKSLFYFLSSLIVFSLIHTRIFCFSMVLPQNSHCLCILNCKYVRNPRCPSCCDWHNFKSLSTYLAVWQCEGHWWEVCVWVGQPHFNLNGVRGPFKCIYQTVVHYTAETSMVFHKHLFALLFPSYKIHLFLQSGLASLDIL